MRHAVPLLLLACLTSPAWAQKKPTPDELKLTERVTLNFEDTRLELVVKGIQKLVKVNLVIDPNVDPNTNVTAEVSEQPVEVLLNRIQKAVGLERTVWAGAYVLHAKGKGPGKEPERVDGKLLSQRIQSLDFERTKLPEVIQRLKTKNDQKYATLSFPVQKHLRASGRTVTARLWNMRLRNVLHHVARLCNVSWTVDKDKVAFLASSSAEASAEGEGLGGVEAEVNPDQLLSGPKVDIDKLVRQLTSARYRKTAIALLSRQAKGKEGVATKVADVVRISVKAEDVSSALAGLEVLGNLEDPSAYAAAATVFKNTELSLDLRTAAGLALGGMKAPEAVPTLIAALDDPWFRISETARKAIIATGEPAVAPLVARYRKELQAKEPKDGILFRALLIFGEIDSKLAKKTLIDTLHKNTGNHDRAVAIRHHAAIGLGMTGDVQMVEPLIVALKRERDFRVAKYLDRSLTWITDHKESPNGDQWQIWWDLEGRRKLLKKRTIDDVLKGAGGELEIPVDEEGLPILEGLDERLTRLAVTLGDEDVTKRRAAWRELEAYGDKALPALRATLKSKNARARANAKAIIERIEGKVDED